MATDIIKSIGTATRDYSTWQAWEDDIVADLVAADERHIGQGYNDSEFTSTTTLLTVAGHTVDATRNIIAETGSGQSFRDHASKATNPLRYNASVGVGLRKTANYNATVNLQNSFTVVRNLQVKNDGSINAISANSTQAHTIDSCILELASGTQPTIECGNATKILNTLILNRVSSGGYGVAWGYPATGAIIAACTIARPSGLTAANAGVQANSTNLEVKNTAVFGFTDFASGTISGDYNGSDDATNIPGGNSNGTLVYADQFEDNGNTTPDFRAISSGDLKFGTPDATNYPDDIIGTTRDATTPWVGAWEVPAATGGPKGVFGLALDGPMRRVVYP